MGFSLHCASPLRSGCLSHMRGKTENAHFSHSCIWTQGCVKLKASVFRLCSTFRSWQNVRLSALTTWEMWRSVLAPNSDTCKQNGRRHVVQRLICRVIWWVLEGEPGCCGDDCFNMFIVSYGYYREEIRRRHSEHCNFKLYGTWVHYPLYLVKESEHPAASGGCWSVVGAPRLLHGMM